MGLFGFFKKNKVELSEQQIKWNRMWEQWANGQTESPYTELMNYHGEINNGGHCQYFTNVENTGDLQKEMSALGDVLSAELTNNLQKAYNAYLILEEKDGDETFEEILKECDCIFFENEEEINRILENYAENF